jgi:hypothetical protein
MREYRTYNMSRLARIGFDELPPELAAALEPRVKRLGYLGEFFKCAAHQPEALLAFMKFTECSKQGLQSALVEVIALSVAGWTANAYERNQHERLCIRSGASKNWIAAVNELNPDRDSPMTAQERALQRLVITILESRGNGATAQFEEIVASLGNAAAMAVLMVIGRYVVHGLIVNTLALSPPVPSIFEDEAST